MQAHIANTEDRPICASLSAGVWIEWGRVCPVRCRLAFVATKFSLGHDGEAIECRYFADSCVMLGDRGELLSVMSEGSSPNLSNRCRICPCRAKSCSRS